MHLIKMIKNLKVKDKLFLTFTGGVSLYLLLAFTSYYFIGKVKGYGDTIAEERITYYTLLLAVITILGAVAGFLATLVISRHIGNRLTTVMNTAKTMALGDLSVRIP
ncbi:MAG: hypothetical protein HY878_05205, partial [Deltaproteobacteria bacterium]|nr:hypothetical protein [Deltaproteobacteria bacterium]